jgi:hypothetical protein
MLVRTRQGICRSAIGTLRCNHGIVYPPLLILHIIEGDILAEGDPVENSSKRRDPKLVGVNCPGKAGIVQEQRGESRESPSKKISFIIQRLC